MQSDKDLPEPPNTPRERPPRYLRVLGGLSVAWAVLGVLLDYLVLPKGSVSAADACLAAAILISGAGLCFGWRWAWFTSVSLAIAGLVIGFGEAMFTADIVQPGAMVTGVLFLLVPIVVALVALFSPRSLRWVRRQPARLPSGNKIPPMPGV
jgi:phosphate/sulfate permease